MDVVRPALARIKDPDAIELFGVDFGAVLMANRLAVSQITGHQVLAVPAEDDSVLTIENSARNGAEVSARVGGGIAGTVYALRFRLWLATSDVPKPLPFDQTMQIRIAEQ